MYSLLDANTSWWFLKNRVVDSCCTEKTKFSITIQVSHLGKNQDYTMATKFADIAKGPKGK